MDKIRFGVVGTNNISRWVIEGGREDSRFEVTAICSRSKEKGEAFAASLDIPHIFTSIDEMASSDLIDAVYIATPNSTHEQISIMCMNHGKHVLCEKPFASNAREARMMVEAAVRNKVVLMEAMISTLNPNFRAAMDRIGEIGTVRRYSASYCQYSSRYDNYKKGIIENAFRRELSNGAVMDIGVYTIYPMVVLFGKPEGISAQGILLETGVDGQGSVHFRYPDMEADVIYSKIVNSFLPTEIQGEEGCISIDHIHIAKNVSLIPRIRTGQGKFQAASKVALESSLEHSPYYYEIVEFIDTIQAGRLESTINSHSNSISVMEIIDEIRRQTGVIFPADMA